LVTGGIVKIKETTSTRKLRWVENIKLYLGERGWGGVDWIGLIQDRGQ
jgi:hypothetical protein